MSRQFALQITKGSSIGKTWGITVKPMCIGRSSECVVRIADATISRRHCEVWLEGDKPRLRDLGSSNDTVLNGKPIEEAELHEGDVITIGPYALRVILIDLATDPAGAPVADSTPATLSLSDAFFIHDSTSTKEDKTPAPHLSDFRELLRINREFARCTDVPELLLCLNGVLLQRFEPDVWWLARLVGAEKKIVADPLPGNMIQAPLPESDIQRALGTESGMLIPRRRTQAGKNIIETVLVAPLILADERIGALALRGAMPRRIYDEGDLEFFLALAHTFTPYLRAAEQTSQLRRDVARMQEVAGASSGLIGSSAKMKEVRDLAGRSAKSELPVLVLGETGTGKELLARMIHDLSSRAKNPYVVVNAAAIPRELFESEMFGHEKGAFTGATRQKAGHFEVAHGGTLFLDEVGDLSLENQARILRVIETGRFHRVGGTSEIAVDVRVVTATNRPIGAKSSSDWFRPDLYHRLSGVVIKMPPLRERKSDIIELVEHFLARTQCAGQYSVHSLTSAAVDKLMKYDWPGNVRELRSCIERAAALAQGDHIEADDIVLPSDSKLDSDSGSHLLTLSEAERHHIVRILKRYKWNIRSAAEALKISRVTLYKKINDYSIVEE